MSNWVGGLPSSPKSSKGEKKAKKEGRLPSSPISHGSLTSKIFFGGAIPPILPNMPKISSEDFKLPKVKFVGGPSPVTKATPPPPPPPLPPSPSSISSKESETSPLPSLLPPTVLICLPSVFDKKPKKKRKRKKKNRTPPPKMLVYVEEEEEEPKFSGRGKLPSIFAISHIPATCQGYPSDENYYKRENVTSLPSQDSDGEGPKFPRKVPSYKQKNAFATIWGKMIDVRNISEVGPHGWHPTSDAPYDILDDGETVVVGPSGWHEPKSE